MGFTLRDVPYSATCGRTLSFVVDHDDFGYAAEGELTVPFASFSYKCHLSEINPGSLNKSYSMYVPMEFENEVLSWNSYGKKGFLTVRITRNGQLVTTLADPVIITADTSLYKPTVSSVSISKIGLFNDKLLANHSKISPRATPDVSGTRGAKVSKVAFSFGSQEYICKPRLFSSEYVADDIMFTSNSSFSGRVTVTDSRGSVGSAPYEPFTVYAYSPPQITSLLVQRGLENKNIDDNGLFIVMNAKFTYTPGTYQNSIAKTEVFTKLRTESAYTLACSSFQNNVTVAFGGSYLVNKSYDVKVVVTDKVGKTGTYTDYITTGAVAMELYRNQAAAFGKPVEKMDGMELAEKWKLYLNESLEIGSVSIGGIYKVPVSTNLMFAVSNMNMNDFVVLDFLFCKCDSTSLIEPCFVILYKSSTSNVRYTLKCTSPAFLENIEVKTSAYGATVSFLGHAVTNSNIIFYRVNSVMKSKPEITVKFSGTKL